MEYFECDVPSDDGLCSDNACPCPEVVIPRGTGYLYIEQSLVNFRRQYPTLVSARRAMQQTQEQMHADAASSGGTFTGFYRLGPILVCEQGAKLRNLDLRVAAADAKCWWQTGRVPLRATPISLPSIKTESRTFKGESAQEAKEAAKAEIPEDQIISLDVTRDAKEDTAKAEGKNSSEAIEQAKARVPSEAFDVGDAKIIRDRRSGVVEVSAYSENEALVAWKSSAPKDVYLENLQCTLEPKKGFLGLGKKKGTWKVNWSLAFLASVSFKMPAEVTVRFKAKK